MLDLVLRYSLTFVLHAALGAASVLAVAWLLYRIGRHFGWQQRGDRGPRWLATVLRVFGIVMLVVATTTTGLQTGSIQVLAQAVEQGAQELVLGAAMEAGKPLGIHSADQKLTIADAERLITRWAPALAERSRDALTTHPWWQRAGNFWQAIPGVLRGWIAHQGPHTETTPRELVAYVWRNAAAPVVASAKWQALVFAYGIGALIVATVALIEWLWLAWTRRPG